MKKETNRNKHEIKEIILKDNRLRNSNTKRNAQICVRRSRIVVMIKLVHPIQYRRRYSFLLSESINDDGFQVISDY